MSTVRPTESFLRAHLLDELVGDHDKADRDHGERRVEQRQQARATAPTMNNRRQVSRRSTSQKMGSASRMTGIEHRR